ncbi:hypothetical protein HZS_4772, partial [Henneguya salminicola]
MLLEMTMNNDKLEPWQEYLKENEDAVQQNKTKIDPKDGTIYEWNEKNKAWFPKVNEDFIVQYQTSYGFNEELKPIQTTLSSDSFATTRPKRKKKQESNSAEPKKEPNWFEVDQSNDAHVYVSGMPQDVTEDEFIDMMTKFGIIMEDPETNKLKIKLYKDSQGKHKGDGLCCYLKPESVDLAINILDDTDMRGHSINVEPAHFELKGSYVPKPKNKKKNKNKKNVNQQKLLDWADREAYKKRAHHRACDDPSAVFDYKKELSEECQKFGNVKKVFIFDRSIDGVASILFRDEESAQKCVK